MLPLHNQSTRLQTTVVGPRTVSFWWKVDSELNFDFLGVAVDDVVRARISGNVDWAQMTVDVPAGVHTVSWTYAKDGSVANGADAGWVDQVMLLAPITQPTLADAVDNAELVWVTTGDSRWTGQTAVTRDLIDAAQSGALVDNQSSRLQTSVVGPRTVSFAWKVASELNFDFLSVAVDDVVRDRISGDVDWQQRTVDVPAGAHVVSWTYAKDRSVSVGGDAGWIDQVTLG